MKKNSINIELEAQKVQKTYLLLRSFRGGPGRNIAPTGESDPELLDLTVVVGRNRSRDSR